LQAYRAVASDLAARPALGHDVFAAPVKATKIDPALIPLADHQSELLVQALQKVLTRLGEKAAVFAVTIDSISVIDRMRMVVDSIKVMGGRTTFWQIIGGVEDRSTAIGVFIALLELCRRRLISVSQAGPLGEIQVQLLDLAQLAANQMDQFIEEVAA